MGWGQLAALESISLRLDERAPADVGPEERHEVGGVLRHHFVAKLGHEDGAIARLFQRYIPDVVQWQDELGVVLQKPAPTMLSVRHLRKDSC